MDKLGLTLGEVSITGFSLGGLITVYATGTTQFQRGFAQSPSVWWNIGDVATQLTDAYNSNGGKRPVAEVVQLGTE